MWLGRLHLIFAIHLQYISISEEVYYVGLRAALEHCCLTVLSNTSDWFNSGLEPLCGVCMFSLCPGSPTSSHYPCDNWDKVN